MEIQMKNPAPAIQAELDRFEKVVAARTSENDFLDLFGKLLISKKFSEAAKPWCVAMLLKESLTRVSTESLSKLVTVLYDTQAAKLMWQGLVESECDAISQPVAKRYFEQIAQSIERTGTSDESTVGGLFCFLQKSGLSPFHGRSIDYLIQCRFDEAILDKICDLNQAFISKVDAIKSGTPGSKSTSEKSAIPEFVNQAASKETDKVF